jgi:hypothetical protein
LEEKTLSNKKFFELLARFFTEEPFLGIWLLIQIKKPNEELKKEREIRQKA